MVTEERVLELSSAEENFKKTQEEASTTAILTYKLFCLFIKD